MKEYMQSLISEFGAEIIKFVGLLLLGGAGVKKIIKTKSSMYQKTGHNSTQTQIIYHRNNQANEYCESMSNIKQKQKAGNNSTQLQVLEKKNDE